MKYLIVAVLAFCSGWYVNGLRYEAQWQEYFNEALKQQAQSIQDARAKEQEMRERADRATKQAKDAIDTITAHYNKLLSDGMPKSGTNNASGMSSNTNSSSSVSKGACKCSESNRAKLQRLYEWQLIIARDCDITATHYNQLIELWKELSHEKDKLLQ